MKWKTSVLHDCFSLKYNESLLHHEEQFSGWNFPGGYWIQPGVTCYLEIQL